MKVSFCVGDKCLPTKDNLSLFLIVCV